MRILVTGGCGFIGSAVIRHLIRTTGHHVVNVDKMTYAASEDALEEARGDPRHLLLRADITDAAAMREIFAAHAPDAVMHLAAESHVDRSIDGPAPFVHTNVTGTFVLLEAARAHWSQLDRAAQARFRFHHISTDEVFGARQPRSNLAVVQAICATLDALAPDPLGPRERLIHFVTDRPGHDFRYEIDPARAAAALDWIAPHGFDRGLRRTVQWYLDNRAWWEPIRRAHYAGQRLGTAP